MMHRTVSGRCATVVPATAYPIGRGLGGWRRWRGTERFRADARGAARPRTCRLPCRVPPVTN